MLCAMRERGDSRPISRMALRKRSRSSAMSIASREAAISSTPYFSSTPSRTRSSAQLSAVWPPIVGSSALGLFFLDDALDRAPVDRLDVDGIGRFRVRHDRRRIGVDQDDAIALFLQRLAGLRAGIVELARLADDDRAGADDQDALEVGTFWHVASCSPSLDGQRSAVAPRELSLAGASARSAAR